MKILTGWIASRYLHEAIRSGDFTKVRTLLKWGANPDFADRFGYTSLHTLGLFPNTEIALLLIQAGANVHARTSDGSTPLHQARHAAIAKILIANGADVSAETREGETPLHDASFSGCNEVVELLIKAGANINSKSGSGDTPLHGAAIQCRFETIKLLMNMGADPHIKNNIDETPLRSAAAYTGGKRWAPLQGSLSDEGFEELRSLLERFSQ